MSKHHITRANELYQGNAYHADLWAANLRRGAPIMVLTKLSLGAPVADDEDGIAEAQAVAGAGNLTIDGALASGGAVTLDVPRAVMIDSSDAGDTTQTATFTGTDVYGSALVETITFNGTTAVNGKKAFKTITQVAISAALAGNGSAGTTDILGLPYPLAQIGDVFKVLADGVDELATSTVVAAVATTATATTGDVRGTVLPATATDGSVVFSVWCYITDKDTLGVAQYGG